MDQWGEGSFICSYDLPGATLSTNRQCSFILGGINHTDSRGRISWFMHVPSGLWRIWHEEPTGKETSVASMPSSGNAAAAGCCEGGNGPAVKSVGQMLQGQLSLLRDGELEMAKAEP